MFRSSICRTELHSRASCFNTFLVVLCGVTEQMFNSEPGATWWTWMFSLCEEHDLGLALSVRHLLCMLIGVSSCFGTEHICLASMEGKKWRKINCSRPFTQPSQQGRSVFKATALRNRTRALLLVWMFGENELWMWCNKISQSSSSSCKYLIAYLARALRLAGWSTLVRSLKVCRPFSFYSLQPCMLLSPTCFLFIFLVHLFTYKTNQKYLWKHPRSICFTWIHFQKANV